MSSDEKQPFLARWSRRKLESAKETAASKPAPSPSTATPAAAAPGGPPSTTKPELPPIDSLKGLGSEYRDFLRPDVDEKLRHAALNKLFRDPHFNVIDLMDVYIDDYSKPDPIPEAMLRSLTHARELLFGDEEREAAAGSAGQGDKADVAGTGRQAQDDAPSRSRASAPEPEDAPPAPHTAGPSKA